MVEGGAQSEITSASSDDAGGVDMEQLADRVYRLMQHEIRLGRVRGESLPKRSAAHGGNGDAR